MDVHVKHISQDSSVLFLSKLFPKFDLPNLGCSLSVSAAYLSVFRVVSLFFF